MHEYDQKLVEREQAGNPIRVAVIGAGQMGTEIITQIGEMRGMQVSVVVDITSDKAVAGYGHSKHTNVVQVCTTLKEADEAHMAGKSIATSDYRLATRSRFVDAVVDATGSTEMGATIAMDAFHYKKHVVMMNVECDVTIGPILRQFAEDAGVVYSLAAGDEPAAIIELYRFATALGFEVVTAGKGKNNPLNIYSNPDTEREKALQRKMNPAMLCEFVDGSKTAVEMAAVSNATGLVCDIRGMHAAHATVDELKHVFIPKEDGGILDRKGIVDFAIGVHPGVFLVVTTDNKRIQDGMVQRDMGEGPYYTLYRPYHLCSIEVPLTVAQCVLYGESTGHPKARLTSECITIAKRDLQAGEQLDGIGGYCYRGSIEQYSVAKAEKLLPLGLAKGCVVSKDISRDTPITYDMIEAVPEGMHVYLRNIQDVRLG
ncbi:MAG: SAF domain-containing protein [Sphaerochaeta sp.]|jgi:predicted homoserine dehydrogenase-like protein|nr:SAF domain-containing protein [Sphaerochaeta sp.]PKL27585.1 MAG: NAD(P)-dependent oxidoreductase [Spirochaetae bacterium HGW-Spirochaetae-2]